MYLRKTCWLGRMQHIPKQSHYVRCLALELLWNSLCGSLAKKFGDPCCRSSFHVIGKLRTVKTGLTMQTCC